MKTFLNSGQVELINGGYLSAKETGKPVSNEAFVSQQKHAEYIVLFAAACKGKTFKAVKIDNVADIRMEVLKSLEDKKSVEFVKGPKEVKQPTHKLLTDEALAFIKFNKDKSRVEKINLFLAKFETMHDFEKHGLFFNEEIVKLNKIYSMKEVIAAVKEVIDLV